MALASSRTAMQASSSTATNVDTSDAATSTASMFFYTFLATSDLLSHTFTFLSFSDLFAASATSQLIHAAADCDKVWRPRLTAALAISTVPTTTTKTSDTTTAPCTPHTTNTSIGDSAAVPSILTVVAAVERHNESRHLANPMHRFPYGRARPRLIPAVTTIVSTEQPLVYHVKLCTEDTPSQCRVDYREVEMERVEAGTVDDTDEGDEKQRDGVEVDAASGGEYLWEVKRVGPRFSGWQVLNMADNRHLLTAPSAPPTRPQSAKQRYLTTFGCSVRQPNSTSSAESALCRTLLAPQPPLPSPTVPPRWFSAHLRDAVAFGAEAPPVPESPFPPLAALPVCRMCRAVTVVAVQAISDLGRRLRHERPLQVDCLLRVNSLEWDARCRDYEDEQEYHRVAITTASSAPVSSKPMCFSASRLYQDESGPYAISHPSNLPFTNPSPPSGQPRSHPHHEHPLRYYRNSPYRIGGYVCNECAANANGQVWHCAHCQFDLCMECAVEWQVPDEAGEEKEGKEGVDEENDWRMDAPTMLAVDPPEDEVTDGAPASDYEMHVATSNALYG